MVKKILLCILCILCILFVATAVQAGWKVHSSWSLNESNTNPRGMHTNATSTAPGDVWVMDATDKRVYQYKPDGTYYRNISTTGIQSGLTYGVYLNKTVGDHNNIFFSNYNSNHIFVMNESGNYQSNFSVSKLGTILISGLTSNATTGKTEHLYVLDTLNSKLHGISYTGEGNTSCSVASYASHSPAGLATNASDTTADFFWLVDSWQSEAYRIDKNCVLLETINLLALGITQPRAIETYYKNKQGTNLLIVSAGDNKVYRITEVDDPPYYTEHAQYNNTIKFGHTNYLAATCHDTIDVASAYLQTNQTGAITNITTGVTSNPLTFDESFNTSAVANFTWKNLFTSTGTGDLSINWSIMCVDSAGQGNETSVGLFNATPLRAVCYSPDINITSSTSATPENMTVTFTGSGKNNCTFYMEPRWINATDFECNYKVTNVSKLIITNMTNNTCILNATFVSLTNGTEIRIDAEAAFKRARPPNLPVALATAALVYIIYVVITVRRRRTD